MSSNARQIADLKRMIEARHANRHHIVALMAYLDLHGNDDVVNFEFQTEITRLEKMNAELSSQIEMAHKKSYQGESNE